MIVAVLTFDLETSTEIVELTVGLPDPLQFTRILRAAFGFKV